ncbi:isocitrate/isopropylmalate dehydrogenase family protein (plasmid) [Ochrobactrum quorumnocens]|uniref:Isocitrate/isopropylmalate dehydrogenase family protein n=1 Tax=Ochrobactrum quorumnocens TaxID=271865 RepID=A0A248UPB8_9HYPH|nr:isocitrate/isopropylmalate dehydrogenase family protein [[Ochrobactrum] quorumnocens]
MKTYLIALIPGPGHFGKSVTKMAWAVLKTAAGKEFKLVDTVFPSSCAYYNETGAMMPDDGVETLRAFDSILLGAAG